MCHCRAVLQAWLEQGGLNTLSIFFAEKRPLTVHNLFPLSRPCKRCSEPCPDAGADLAAGAANQTEGVLEFLTLGLLRQLPGLGGTEAEISPLQRMLNFPFCSPSANSC